MKPDSEVSPAAVRWRRAQERKRRGLTRIELWVPDYEDLCEQLADERRLADWHGRDRGAVEAAVRDLLADWLRLTRERGDPIRRAMVKARIVAGRSPPTAELEKIQRRNENLCLAAALLRCDGTSSGAAKLADAYRRFRTDAWPGLRHFESCPANCRGVVEQFFFEALKAWDAAVTPAQMIEALKRGATST